MKPVISTRWAFAKNCKFGKGSKKSIPLPKTPHAPACLNILVGFFGAQQAVPGSRFSTLFCYGSNLMRLFILAADVAKCNAAQQTYCVAGNS